MQQEQKPIQHWVKRANWKGPLYLNSLLGRNEILEILNQLQAITKINAPLLPGIEAAFESTFAQKALKNGANSSFRAYRFFVLFLLCLLSFCALIAATPFLPRNTLKYLNRNADVVLLFFGITMVVLCLLALFYKWPRGKSRGKSAPANAPKKIKPSPRATAWIGFFHANKIRFPYFLKIISAFLGAGAMFWFQLVYHLPYYHYPWSIAVLIAFGFAAMTFLIFFRGPTSLFKSDYLSTMVIFLGLGAIVFLVYNFSPLHNIQLSRLIIFSLFTLFGLLVVISTLEKLLIVHTRRYVLATLHARLMTGASLSEVMKSLSHLFPSFCADLVSIGEATGQLTDSFNLMNDKVLKQLRWRGKLRAQMRYLLLLVFMISACSLFFMEKVAPTLNELSEESGLDTSTLYLLPFLSHLGDVTQTSPTKPIIAVLYLTCLLLVLFRFKVGQRCLHHFFSTLFLRCPIFGPMIMRFNLANMTLMLEMLLRAGVPLTQSLATVAQGDIDPIYRRFALRIQKHVEQGERFSDACKQAAQRTPLPPSFLTMLSLAEESGKLPEMLARLRRYYLNEAQKREAVLSQFIFPLGIVIAAFLVLLLEINLFYPIIAVGDHYIL